MGPSDFLISISPSQLEDFWHRDKDRCPRRWWLGKGKHRLPTTQRHSAAFGDVLHAVIERWLRSDDTGVDIETGKPVELYPKGWDRAVDRFGKLGDFISPVEAAQLQTLVSLAIEERAIYRMPGRLIEKPFQFFLDTKEGRARFKGWADVRGVEGDHGEVWDHKSHKAGYAKSAKGVRESPQMLLTALAMEHEHDWRLESVTLRHISFIRERGKERIHKRRGGDPVVTRDELREFQSELVTTAEEMIRLRAFDGPPLEVEGPAPKSRACAKFNQGCQFLSICSPPFLTIDQYRARMEKANFERQAADKFALTADVRTASFMGVPVRPATLISNLSETEPRRLPMSGQSLFAAKLAARAAVNAAGSGAPPSAPAPVAPPVQQQSPAPAAKPPVQSTAQAVAPPPGPAPALANAPPWAIPGCPACGGAGLNTNGNPCRICNINQKKKNGPTSDDYVIEPDGQGGIIWERKAAGTPQTTLPVPPAAAAAAQAKIEEPAPAPAPEPAEEQADDGEGDDDEGDEDLLAVDLTQTPDQRVPEAPKAAPASTPAPAAPPQGEAKVVTPDQPKRGPGRPPGAKNKPKAAAVAVPPPEALAQAVDSSAPANFSLGVPAGFDPAKRKGLIIIVNCYFMANGADLGKVSSIDQLFTHYMGLLAQNQNVPHWAHVNAFKRRDALAAEGAKIAAAHDGEVLVGRTDSPDLVAFVVALRPYATLFIDGSQR